MKKIFYLLIGVFYFTISQAQTAYFSMGSRRIGQIDLETCSFDYLKDRQGHYIYFDLTAFSDLALHPDGRLFGVVNVEAGALIAEIDIFQKQAKDTIAIIPDVILFALACDSNGLLYSGRSPIFTINPDTKEYNLIGHLPFGEEGGDFIFYQNKLLAATEDLNGVPRIYTVNIDDPSSSEILHTLPQGIGFGGMAITYDDAGQQQLVGSHWDGSDDPILSTLYGVNFGEDSLEVVCDAINLRGRGIIGLTSASEFRTNGQLQIDLDADNSSGRLIDHFQIDSLCSTSFPIADNDVYIQSSLGNLDSIIIEIADTARGILTGASNSIIHLEGDGTKKLVLVNTGTATLADFEELLKFVRFRLVGEDIRSGEDKVHTTLYADNQSSAVAKTFVDVDVEARPSAGEDATVEVCESGSIENVFEALGGNPRAGGNWIPSLFNEDDFYYPLHDTAGIYKYVVQEGGCAADTAIVEVIEHPEPVIELSSNYPVILVELCPNDTIRWDVTQEDVISYTWNDGSTKPIFTVTEEGEYYVETLDRFGCYGFSQAVVRFSDTATVQTQQTITRCADEPFMWQGQSFSTDTVLCQTYNRASGCDSTHCITLQFLESPQIEAEYVFCGGSEQAVEGVKVSRDTSFCTTYQAANGCDSIRCVSIEFTPPLEGQAQASICQGESYPFGSQLLTQSGTYLDTVQLAGACDSIIQLQLTVNPTYESTLDTSIIEGEVLEIGGQPFTETGNYELNFLTQAGCDSLFLLQLEVLPDTTTSTINANPAAFYAPTILSQSNPQYAATFMLYAKNGQPGTIRRLSIVDALGRVIFSQQDIPLGATEQGWRAEQVASGIYFYQAEVLHNESRTLESGKIVVVE